VTLTLTEKKRRLEQAERALNQVPLYAPITEWRAAYAELLNARSSVCWHNHPAQSVALEVWPGMDTDSPQ
jgi:hypothetical protein